ncbi:hypothetical protein NE237_026648 [Protea cynaroides]|uniref:Bet v I/Major latex protein domain-containing protein n=1 Tax=Protea cynaroides TaxID=273540 RepID=A0A9Q0K1P3_9MAGN|nr:hypothetical protein NE237_026648 [Protea cynaroides]
MPLPQRLFGIEISTFHGLCPQISHEEEKLEGALRSAENLGGREGLLITSKAENLDGRRMEGGRKYKQKGESRWVERRRMEGRGKDKPLRRRRWRQVFCDIAAVASKPPSPLNVRVSEIHGAPGLNYFKELVTKVDDKKRMKETEVIEGGKLELGFLLYRVRFEILENDTNSSSIIISTIEYEIKDEFASNSALFVSTKSLEIVAKAIGNYLTEKKANNA